MNSTHFTSLTFVTGLVLLGSHLQAQNAGVGSSGTQSTQTFPGDNPAPSTASTPTEASQNGTVPGTAKTGPSTPGGPTPQTAPNVTSNPATAQPSGTMSTIVVNGSTEGSILPSDQTVTSVYGTDMSLQDTPRSVTAVSSELLQAANISSVSDFVKVTPSAYTTDQFGVANVPTIRGQNAEVFINGMQRTTRSGGPPTSFNSVEQADVVTGPASSVYGPTQNTGGYVNFVTKQPFFDAFHSDTEFTYGSYDEKIWTEDFGAPIIKNQLAYRVSYQGDYAGSYYQNEKLQSNDGFVALAWTPNTGFRVDFNSEFYDGRFDENTGWNRPTQGLISGHQYSTGGATQPANGTLVGGTGVTGPSSPATPGPTYGGLIYSPGTQQLSEQATLVSPNDSDFGKDYNAELTETYNVNDNITLINRSYYEYYYIRNSEFAQLYINIDQSNVVQDRFEAHIDFDTPIGDGSSDPSDPSKSSMADSKDMKASTSATSEPFIDPKSEIVTGLAFKYVDALGYGDFFNEALNATDLTTTNFPEVTEPLGGVSHIPGTNLYATPGSFGMPNTFNETAYEGSAYFQHQITFTPQWILLYSGRGDVIFDDINDPLGSVAGNFSHETTAQVLGTGDVSVDYKPFKWATVYGTFDFNESTIGNNAGGFAYYSDGAPATDYHYQNFLYEGGIKLDLLNHTLFTTADGYYQTHNTTSAFGASEQLRTFGADLQTIYQPDKHFYMAINESYLNATVVDPGGVELTQNVYDAFSTNSTGVNGTGVGAPNFAADPPGNYREAGLPQFVFSGIASYKLDSGFGASANYVITDPIPTSELANVWIPWQYEIDTSLFYEQKSFSARVTLFNITDQHNFSSGGTLSGSGNDLVTIHEPFHWEATVGYKF